MQENTREALLAINRKFYQTFGDAFAHTRRRIQPGIRRLLTETIPPHGIWLDLGCGSGALGLEWIVQKRTGLYLGLDFSPVLLEEARKAVAPQLPAPGLDVKYLQADLSDPTGQRHCPVPPLTVCWPLPPCITFPTARRASPCSNRYAACSPLADSSSTPNGNS